MDQDGQLQAADGGGPQKTSLSNRLSGILSASFADLDIRDALETLDARGIQNDAETRRRLRLDVQKEVIECNEEIVDNFGLVSDQLRRVGAMIANLNKCCEDMREHIDAAHEETAPILVEAAELMDRRRQIESKQKVLGAFNKHFIVSAEDLAILTSSTEPVDDRFFEVLKRVKKIYLDCQLLLGSEDQRLGVEIMDRSSKTLNSAFQKLYRWIQQEFKHLDLEDPHISGSVRRALRVLAERPALFQTCLDLFAEAREHVFSDAFYAALTGSEPGVKSMDLSAHDPLRYVGDMLAWTHSTTVSEQEALEGLFISDGDEIAKGLRDATSNDPWARVRETEEVPFDGRKALHDLINRNLAGVARSLNQRIEQVIHSHEDLILVYKIYNLLIFYRNTFSKVLGTDSNLVSNLSSLEKTAFTQFKSLMQEQVSGIQPDLVHAPEDVTIPDFLRDALDQLKQLMSAYDTSFIPAASREEDFAPIMTEALDPFLAGCEMLAKLLPEPKNSIFTINCLLASRALLQAFDFVTDRLSETEDTIEELARRLIDHQHRFFLTASGLQPLVDSLSNLSDSRDDLASLLNLETFKPEALAESSQTLDDFLPSALMDATDGLVGLQSPKLTKEIIEEAAELFCQDFEMVEAKLVAVDETLEEEDSEGVDGLEERGPLRAQFPRTSGEIRVLLS